MPDERIVAYLREGLRKGYSVDSLRQTLLSQGWENAEVDEAISSIRGYTVSSPPGVQFPSRRPTGVTIICILGYVGSVLALVAGILSIFFSAIVVTAFPLPGLDSLFAILGALSLLLGIVGLVAFSLLLKMKKIGWIIVTIEGIISIIIGALTFNVLGIALWIIILVYLWRKKDLFV